jgi:hypothetical protein
VALAVTVVAFFGFVAVFAQSAGRSPVEGVWEVRDVTFAKPPANPVTKPTGIVIFSGNHYSQLMLQNSARPSVKQADIDKATAEQLRAYWGPVIGNAGTFKITGNTIMLDPAVAKNAEPMASGWLFEETFTLKGDTLTLTLVKTGTGPMENPRTFHLVRAK